MLWPDGGARVEGVVAVEDEDEVDWSQERVEAEPSCGVGSDGDGALLQVAGAGGEEEGVGEEVGAAPERRKEDGSLGSFRVVADVVAGGGEWFLPVGR